MDWDEDKERERNEWDPAAGTTCCIVAISMRLTLVLLALIFASARVDAADETFSITLTGISAEAVHSPPPDYCVVDAEINNNTANHVDTILAHVLISNDGVMDHGMEIKLNNLRANQQYTARFEANTSCL